MKPTLALFLALAAMGSLQASEVNLGSAAIAAPWLQLSEDARATAMGQAQVAVASSTASLAYNPADLAFGTGQDVAFSHLAWIQGSSIEHLAYANSSLLPLSGLGASLDWFNFGSIQGYSLDSGGNPVAGDTLHPSAMNLNLGWGQGLPGTHLAAGAGLKIINQNLDGQDSAWSVAIDLGVHWQSPLPGLSAGLVIQNLGTQLAGASLPLNLKVGAGYSLAPRPKDTLTLALDGNLDTTASDGSDNSYNLGGEYWFNGIIAARLGWQGADRKGLNGLSGLCVGLGACYEAFQLDYAFSAIGEIGNGQQLSLAYHFGSK